VDWQAVTALSSVFTGLVVGVTAAVAVDQLRQLRVRRRDTAAVEFVRSLQDIDFTRAFRLVMSLPAGISASELRARGLEYEEASQTLSARFEMVGLLVYRGAISFDVTEDLAGGAVLAVWERVKDQVHETRAVQNYPVYLEWFQWLAEQFEKRERLQQAPAHVRHRDWTPAAGDARKPK
jgi:hypothetical protein